MPAALSGHDDRSGEDRSTGVDRATAARGSPHAEWVERSRPPVYWRWLIPSPDGRMLNVAGPQRLRHPRRRTPRCTAAPLDGCDRSTGARPPAMKHRLRARLPSSRTRRCRRSERGRARRTRKTRDAGREQVEQLADGDATTTPGSAADCGDSTGGDPSPGTQVPQSRPKVAIGGVCQTCHGVTAPNRHLRVHR